MQQILSRTAIVVDKDPAVYKAIFRIGQYSGFDAEAFFSYPDFIDWLDGQSAKPAHAMHAYCLVMDVGSLATLEERALPDTIRDIPKILIGMPHYSCELAKLARTGFFDFIAKPFSIEQIRESLLSAFIQHEKVSCGALQITERFGRLSKREHEVGALVVRGLTNPEIAAQLGISIKTVKAHRAKVMQKTESETLVELIRYFDSYVKLNAPAH